MNEYAAWQIPPGHDVKHLSPAYFALVMATGIVSLGARDLQIPMLASGLFALNLLAYAILAGLTVLRALRYPSLFFADLTDHRQGPAFFAAVAASCILGTQVLVMSHDLASATVLFVVGVVLWVGLTYTIFTAVAVQQNKPSLQEGINGTWLIAVVATQSISVLAALIAREASPSHHVELNFLALSMWLWGGMFYIWIISLVFYRYSFFALLPQDLTPAYWINMGAMAISVLAGTLLMQNAVDTPLLASVLPFIKGFTVFYWATATWWIPMLLVLTLWRHLVRRFPFVYEPQYWAAVFPLGMYAVATGQMAAVLELPFLNLLPPGVFAATLAAWTFVFVGLLRALGKIAFRHRG